jgi:hypothetical protein
VAERAEKAAVILTTNLHFPNGRKSFRMPGYAKHYWVALLTERTFSKRGPNPIAFGERQKNRGREAKQTDTDQAVEMTSVESLENQTQVFHPSHRPWKSLRDSHIPTPSTTALLYKMRPENYKMRPENLSRRINNLEWARLNRRSGPNVLAKRKVRARVHSGHQARYRPHEKGRGIKTARLYRRNQP